MRDEAVQRWPEVPNAPQTAPSTARSRSASSITMMTFLPPISSEQMALRSAHAEATMRPVSVEPVKEIKPQRGMVRDRRARRLAVARHQLTTPAGMPASSHALTRL